MADNDKNTQQESGGGSKLPLIALALTNIVSLGGLAYFVLVDGDSASANTPTNVAPESVQEAIPDGPTVALGTFNITLADPGQNRYLKAVLKAQVNEQRAVEEVEGREPEIRDRIIDYLSSLTVKETQGSASKASIRGNLKKRINNILRTGEVDNIYLTEFVTQ